MKIVACLILSIGVLGAQAKFPTRICEAKPPQVQCWNLRHVSVLYRHTAKAPSYVDNSLIRRDLYPRGLDRSTVKGLEQASLVAVLWKAWFRNGLLTGDVNEVYARSADLDRCFETSQVILYELFSPGPRHPTDHYRLPFDPVPILRASVANDSNALFCRKRALATDFSQVLSTPVPSDVSNRFETLNDVISFIKVQTATERLHYAAFFAVVLDTYISHEWDQNKLPKWAQKEWPAVVWAADVMYAEFVKSVKVCAGRSVIPDIIKNLRDASKPSYHAVTKKLSLFSDRGLVVSSILSALNGEPITYRPKNLASVFFELYENDVKGQYGIRIRSSDGVPNVDELEYSPLSVIQLKACNSDICPAEQVLRNLEQYYSQVESQL